MVALTLSFKTLKQETFALQVDSEDTILKIKEKIQETQKHDVSQQKLIFSGKILADDKTVGEYNITEKDFLVVMVSKAKAKPDAAAPSSSAASTPVAAAATPKEEKPAETVSAPVTAANNETAPTEATANTTSTTATNENVDTSLVTGSHLEGVIQNMMEMGFERDQCLKALRASFNNPDRAVEYLFNGIPQHILDEMDANQQAQQAQAAAPQLQQPTQQETAPVNEDPSAPLNLFTAAQQQAQAQQQQQQQGGNPDFANLRNTQHFQQIRQLVQSNPALLQPLLQQLGQSNPELLRSINADPNGFLQALLEGVEEEGADVHPGSSMVQVTQEEKDAIDRLVALGFERNIVIEAYFACEKNEELAANYLFEHGTEDYE